jgi:NAD(P)-dependent dehydrogenase (short-subunit alcohol dehydrogenase family)
MVTSTSTIEATDIKVTGLVSRWHDDFVANMPSMSGRKIAITGTTTGTGFAAANALVRKGAHVFLLNRASERASTSLNAIRQACKGDAKAVHVECDLQDFASVRAAAASVEQQLEGDGLYALLNNAGSLYICIYSIFRILYHVAIIFVAVM